MKGKRGRWAASSEPGLVGARRQDATLVPLELGGGKVTGLSMPLRFPAVTGKEGALLEGASIKVVPRVEDPVLKRDGVSVL